MSNEITCPSGHKLQVRPEHAGKEVRCPICKSTLVVPDLWSEPREQAAPPPPPPPPSEQPAPPIAGAPPKAPGTPVIPASTVKLGGYAALIVGLVLVIGSRGCDSLSGRNEARLAAKEIAAKNAFDRETDDKLAAAKESEQAKIKSDRAEARAKLEKGAWRDLGRDSADSEVSNAINGYWRELGFVVGTIILAIGLLVIGILGVGAERTICYIMIAIITFSLYIGGVAWAAALKNLFSGAPRPAPRAPMIP
ncbi:MAG: hypothetical protein PHU85_10005 [Phycisphaerae bacterium]|nr:hypothetical protein [Phycisphaerae bacterium]